jgi:arylsulfatase A-like enzyme
MKALGMTALRLQVIACASIALLVAPVNAGSAQGATTTALDRTVLPIPEPTYPPITELDARNAKAPPRFQVKAPEGVPNVVIVLLDDFGFGQSSAFGGPISMPTAERLANNGLLYNRFHTTALCSPTRVALLTGRNHHSANAGIVMNMATSFPGYTSTRPNSVATLAEMLQLNGYSTGYFGKNHEVPLWEMSVSGPFHRWPTHSGFDKFYGMFGETNHWAPTVYEGTTKVEVPNDPNYHFTVDIANQAMRWMRSQKALTPDKPFFLYFSTGATHAPHHAPKEYIAKYKGQFDQGWDKLREETLTLQKKLGVVPQDAALTPRPEYIPAWDSLSPDEKRLYARQMEVFAGFAEHADHEIGRLLDALEQTGQMDNTLVFYILGDNGAQPAGGRSGLFNDASVLNQVPEKLEDILKRLDDLGGPKSHPEYSAGWAIAGNTPFQWGKAVASHFGGTRNPLIVHWPKRIKAKRELRSQFAHIIDIAPTVLEATGLPEPKSVNGTPQKPIEGVSLVYSFDDAGAKERHTTQYFEMFGNRAIYHDGWTACAIHTLPWTGKPEGPFEKDKWELYNVNDDFSQARDLAAQNPQKLKELQDLFLKEAVKYHVLPLDDRGAERLNPEFAGRPDLAQGRTSLTVYEGMTMTEDSFINVKNRSHVVTAEVEVPQGANGVILAQGGRFAGWSLYMKDGKPMYAYNWVAKEKYTVAADKPVPAGKATIRFEFAYDGGGAGKGGTGSLFVNGEKVGEGRIDNTCANVFSVDETADVGRDDATPVTEDYKARDNTFTGRIGQVTVALQ